MLKPPFAGPVESDKAILPERVNGCAGMAQALAASEAEHAEPPFPPKEDGGVRQPGALFRTFQRTY